MEKKLQVFISSTYTDLIEERQAAVQAILDAGHIPAGMELFKAGKSQMETIKKWINDSDVYMLILGSRYGSVEEMTDKSYTQLEYEYALKQNMPVFAIVLDKDYHPAKTDDTPGEYKDKFALFKKEVGKNIYRSVKNIDQIPAVIHAQLNSILNDPAYRLTGWVRADAAPQRENTLPKVKANPYGTCYQLEDTGLEICPQCYNDGKITYISTSFGSYTCPKCGYSHT